MTDLADLLKRLADGEIPTALPSDCECREELQQLIDSWVAIVTFTRAMANGDLSAKLDLRGPLAGALKALHANLRHLTWQTKEIAAGDFTQRVEFLGDFSASFNHMVESLARARDNLTKKNQELSESKARFRNLFEKNTSVMWLVDPATGEIIDVNAAAVAFYGYSKAQLTRMRVFDINKMSPEGLAAEMKRAAKGESNIFFFRHHLASGEVRDVEVHASPIKWEGRALVLSIMLDVTRRKQVEEALKVSEERLRLALQAANQSWFEADFISGKVSVSPEYARMLGYEPDEFHTDVQNWLAHVHPDDRDVICALIQTAIHDEAPLTAEYRRQSKSGDWKWIRSTGKVVQWDDNHRATRIIGIHADITERKRAERELVILTTAINRLPDTVLLMDEHFHFVYANDAACRSLGYTREEFATMTPVDIDPDLDFESLKVIRARNKGYSSAPTFERRHRARDGHIYPVEISPSLVEFDGVQYSLTLSRDITERKQMEEQIRQLAFFDPLTKLPNRRLFADRINQAMAVSKRGGHYCAVMYADLDNFKPLNDAHGHEAGDLLLIDVANRLKSCVREMDTVARVGGDEFVILICELDVDKIESARQARVIAEKIRGALALPYVLEIQREGGALTTVEHYCSASIGVTLFVNHEADQVSILDTADKAMYQAKEAGRNSIRFL